MASRSAIGAASWSQAQPESRRLERLCNERRTEMDSWEVKSAAMQRGLARREAACAGTLRAALDERDLAARVFEEAEAMTRVASLEGELEALSKRAIGRAASLRELEAGSVERAVARGGHQSNGATPDDAEFLAQSESLRRLEAELAAHDVEISRRGDACERLREEAVRRASEIATLRSEQAREEADALQTLALKSELSTGIDALHSTLASESSELHVVRAKKENEKEQLEDTLRKTGAKNLRLRAALEACKAESVEFECQIERRARRLKHLEEDRHQWLEQEAAVVSCEARLSELSATCEAWQANDDISQAIAPSEHDSRGHVDQVTTELILALGELGFGNAALRLDSDASGTDLLLEASFVDAACSTLRSELNSLAQQVIPHEMHGIDGDISAQDLLRRVAEGVPPR